MTLSRLARAYSRLKALREDLPPGACVAERFLQEYDRILEDELSAEVNVREFQIEPEFEVRTCRSDQDWPLIEDSSATTYQGGKYVVDRTSFVVRLDAVLRYFQLLDRVPELQRLRPRAEPDKLTWLTRALAHALALKENLPPGAYISHRFVHEYHQILRQALPPGYGLAELYLRPEYEVRKFRRPFDRAELDAWVAANPGELLVRRASFLMKVDAVISYVNALSRVSRPEPSRRGVERART